MTYTLTKKYMINDDLLKIMNKSKADVVRLFFKQPATLAIKDELEKELKKVLLKQGLPYNLTVLKAMKEGMDLFSAGLGFKNGEDVMKAKMENGYISIMCIEYFILMEEDKVQEAIDNSLKTNIK